MPEPTISVVVVTYRQGEGVRPALEALSAQLRRGDELIVIDNASGDDTPRVVEEAAPAARLVPSPSNEGFPAACNRGAARAFGDIVVFLNPDAVPAAGWREAIAAPLTDGSDWTAWQALVTADGGTTVNTRGGVVHFTGIAWAGGAGEPIGDEANLAEPGFVSGACLAIRRHEFERLGGFAGDFFLYHEDVDLSLRVRLAGGALGVASDARVDHDYEFDKGPAKWRHLERNRWATLIRTYPAAAARAARARAPRDRARAPRGGGGGRLATAEAGRLERRGPLVRAPTRERSEIQATAEIGAARFAAALTPGLGSAYLGAAGRSRVLNGLLAAYWWLVLRLLALRRSA